MKLYRATRRKSDAKTIPVDSCWTDDLSVAQVYTDNPGFGGSHIVSVEINLGSCADWRDENGGTQAMIRDLMGDSEDADEVVSIWSGYQPFQALGNDRILRNLARARYDWIIYTDDYPEGATCYRRMR